MTARGGDPSTWATVRLRLRLSEPTRTRFAQARDHLEEIGAIMAAESGVGGVELRGPETLGGPAGPELWLYTEPAAAQRVAAQAQAWAERFELPVDADVQHHAGDDWRDAWKRFYPAQTFGDGALGLRPSWTRRPPGAPTTEIVLDPGRAFGTGLHETTRLCLEALCALARGDHPPVRIALDLGCGSGILALATARLLNPQRLIAADTDADAVATTRENAAQNQLAGVVETVVGDLDGIAADVVPDLVVANIRAEVLEPLAPALARRVADRATVILSGILGPEAAGVEARFHDAGFSNLEQTTLGDWVALRLARTPP